MNRRACFLLSLIPMAVMAQSRAEPPAGFRSTSKVNGPPSAAIPTIRESTDYLRAALTAREQFEAAPPADRIALGQFLASELAQIGRHSEAQEIMATQPRSFAPPLRPGELDELEPVPALESILKLAEGRRLVIINEAHHLSRHRAFATRLIEGLRQRGYGWFAAETLSNPGFLGVVAMETMKRRGHPNLSDGWYSRDPLHGDLIRRAIQVGMTPVAYEHVPLLAATSGTPGHDALERSIAEREEGQARNLKTRVFDRDPKAKLVVFVGYSHVWKRPEESPRGQSTSWMAARLWKLTGIEPLSIEQTSLSPAADRAHDTDRYRALLTRGWLNGGEAIALRRRGDRRHFTSPAVGDRADISVIHPPERVTADGRPEWLAMGGYRRAVPVAGLSPPPAGEPRLLQAILEPEDLRFAVPMDQLELRPGDPPPTLMLPTGGYRVRLIDRTGKILESRTIAVK